MKPNTPDGGDAFPRVQQDSDADWRGPVYSSGGMSLRDWFAGQALAGLLAAYGSHAKKDSDGALRISVTVTKAAYDAADAMLSEREKGKR